MPDLIAFVNGKFLPAKEAAVSIFDRGLRWGDGIYEVERTFNHVPFRLDYHLERLAGSLRYTRITPDATVNEIGGMIEKLVGENSKRIPPESDMEVAQIITRGDVGALPSATIIMYCRELDWRTLANAYEMGVRLTTSSIRRVPQQSLSPNVKVSNKMSQFIAEHDIKSADPAARPLMLDCDGNVAEEASSNVFFVSKGKLMTPSTTNCLPGISRRVTLEIAEKIGLETYVGLISPFDAANADEAFLTSTSPCMIIVTHLDGRPIGDGTAAPGPVSARLLDEWKKAAGVDFVEQAVKLSKVRLS